MKWSQEDLEQLYQQVNAKAIADEEFRKALLADPKAVLEQEAGQKLPDDLNLKIIENDNGFAATYIVPDFVCGELDAKELAPDDLSQVSGGQTSLFFIVNGCVDCSPLVAPCGSDFVAPKCPGKVEFPIP